MGFFHSSNFSLLSARCFFSSSDGGSGPGTLEEIPGIKAFYREAREMMGNHDAFGPAPVVVFFNVFNFRTYNRRYGFDKGDAFLSLLAQSIANAFPCRAVCRVYVDHFAVFASESEVDDAITDVKLDFDSWGDTENMALQAGVYRVDDLASHPLEWLDCAQLAANTLREDPNSYLHYYNKDKDLPLESNRRSFVLGHFMDALRDGDIRVYYQPVVRVGSQKLCSVEALARWLDKKEGMIPPDSFIPILESFHLIGALDQFVIQKACEDLSLRRRKRLPIVPVSLNLSYEDFWLFDVAGYLDVMTRRYGLEKRLLKVEITETALKKDPKAMALQMEKIHERGYEIWMDDFGSGYSSLNVLSDFTFDEIKIDMKFLKRFDSKNRIIVSDVVHMSKKMGMKTLAEGVETKEQVLFLRGIGCEKAQGYYFGRPEPLREGRIFWESGLEFETEAESEYEDAIGRVNVLDQDPLGKKEKRTDLSPAFFLLEMEGGKTRVLFSRFQEEKEVPLSLKFLEEESFQEALSHMDVSEARYFPLPENSDLESVSIKKIAEDVSSGRSAFAVLTRPLSMAPSKKEPRAWKK